jgi:hypothetical protein
MSGDSKLVIGAVIVALVGAYLAGTTLRDHQLASIRARNHSGIEPRDVFAFRDRPRQEARREWRDCSRGSVWSDHLDCLDRGRR